MTARLPGPARWRIFLILLAVTSVNTAYTILIPLVPQIQRDAGLDEAGIALMFAVYAGAKAVAQPLGGLWVDRWRARHVALLSLLMIAVCVYLLGTARTPAAVLAARTAWGIGAGLLTPALYQGVTELCARYGFPTNRAMAWFGASAVIGLLLGPAVAGLTVGLGLYWLCFGCAVITVWTGAGMFAALREPAADNPAPDNPAADMHAAGGARATTGESLPRAAWIGTVVLFGVLDLFTNLAYSALEPTIPLYLRDASQISVVFVLGMATFAVVSWQLGRSRGGPRPAALIAWGCTIGVAGFAALSWGGSVWTVAPCMVLIMVSQPMLYLAARWGTAQLRESGRPMGLAFGIFGAISDVGYLLGPLVGVFLFGVFGSAGFALVGLIGALGLLCIGAVRRRDQSMSEAVSCPVPRSPRLRTARLFSPDRPLRLRAGGQLDDVSVAYETFGSLNAEGDNAVFVCHALTGSSHVTRHDDDDVPGWWESMVGPGRPIDTDRYFVVCADVLGGCAGTTGPWSPSPAGIPYGADFPAITLPDMVTVHRALVRHLGLARPLLAVIGGSLGGMQALEWLLRHPGDAAGFFVIAATAAEGAEGLAWHAIGRTAIRSDPKFAGGHYAPDDPPASGQGLARMVAHMTYLSEAALEAKFARERDGERYAVESYLRHQADKLNARFDPNSYLVLTTAMDSFDAFADAVALPSPADVREPAVHLFSFASDRLFGDEHSNHIRQTLTGYGISATHYRDTSSVAGHDAFLLNVTGFLSEVERLLNDLARQRLVLVERS